MASALPDKGSYMRGPGGGVGGQKINLNLWLNRAGVGEGGGSVVKAICD